MKQDGELGVELPVGVQPEKYRTTATKSIEIPGAWSREEFDRLFVRLSSWREWADSSRGAFNRVSADSVRLAALGVRSGRSVELALPWDTLANVDNARPALHYMVELDRHGEDEPSTNTDFLAADYHGKAITHLDALSHIAYRSQLFGGEAARSAVDSRGAHFGSVASLGHYVGRGVLLDMPVTSGVDWLEPGARVRARDLLEAEKVLDVRVGEADAVLLRTGHQKRRRVTGPWDSSSTSAGWDIDVMPLLAERRPALLGADGDSDARPSPVYRVDSPIHVLAITAMGIPLLDNLDLEALSDACALEGRYEFLLMVAPLNIPNGTGSPVNPIAIF